MDFSAKQLTKQWKLIMAISVAIFFSRCSQEEELGSIDIQDVPALSSNSVKLSISSVSADVSQSSNGPSNVLDGSLSTR